MWIENFWQILFLKSQAYFLPEKPDNRLAIILFIVITASISEAIGQSAILFVNRVKKSRFLASLLSSSLIYVFNYFFWVIGISYVASKILKIDTGSAYKIAYIVALAYLPRLFGFLVFTPLLGSAISVLLIIWGMLIMHMSLVLNLGLQNNEALLIIIFGFIITQLIKHSFGYPLIAFARALTKRVAGTELDLDFKSINTDIEIEIPELDEERRDDAD